MTNTSHDELNWHNDSWYTIWKSPQSIPFLENKVHKPDKHIEMLYREKQNTVSHFLDSISKLYLSKKSFSFKPGIVGQILK